MRKKGEFIHLINDNNEKRWPWMIRGVHDWVSPNGVEFKDKFENMVPYPDEQKNFLGGRL